MIFKSVCFSWEIEQYLEVESYESSKSSHFRSNQMARKRFSSHNSHYSIHYHVDY